MANTSTPFSPPRPSFILMRILGVLNRWMMLRGRFRIRRIDFPRADRERLAYAVNRRTSAFLSPNHPEFGCDWMIDKEISTYVAPRMASWAAHEIVRSAPWFWTRNNLVANNGGDAAAEYSVMWALRGHGVLLHPEGSVHWTADTIQPLFNGIAEMATEAARRAAAAGATRPTFIVPVVWKVRYTQNVGAALHADMERIERYLGFGPGPRGGVSERFRRLQENVLAMQMARFGFNAAAVRHLDFFSRQEAFRAHLLADVESRHAIEPTDSIERRIARLRRAARDAGGAGDDLKKLTEASRLGGFNRDVYGTPTLAQEQIGESLKRLRGDLVVRGVRNVLHNFLPRPYGRRVAHVRVPDPICIDPERASGNAGERAAYVAWLIAQTRLRMQAALDAINHEIEPEVDAFSRINPFFVRGAHCTAHRHPAVA